MQCPRCQTEVSDWHFYCPNCRTLVQGYGLDEEKPRRGKIERVGARVLNVVAGIFIIGVLVLMGRAVQWKELFNAIRGDTGVSADATSPKAERASRTRAPAAQRGDSSPTPAKTAASVRPGKSPAVESVRAMQQKIEELPAVEEQPQAPVPKPPASPAKVENSPPASASESASIPRSTAKPVVNDVRLGVEQIDAKTAGETGMVAINSYAPARIYVDGQFSGTTPRTIRLTAGDHQIRLIADGYEDWTRRIRLKSRQQVGIMASMKKKIVQ